MLLNVLLFLIVLGVSNVIDVRFWLIGIWLILVLVIIKFELVVDKLIDEICVLII